MSAPGGAMRPDTANTLPASREAAYGRLADAVQGPRQGECQSLLILGESGIGKTHLWRLAMTRELRPGDLWAYHKAPQSGGVPFQAAGDLISQLVSRRAERDAVSPGELLRRIMALPGTHQTVRELVRWILPDELGGAIGVGERQDQRVDLSGGLAQLLREVGKHAIRGGGSAPGSHVSALVVVDDLQWVDSQSLDVFRSLTRNPSPLGIVFIARPEAQDAFPWIAELVTVTVGPLAPEESIALAEQEQLPPENAERARGNPMAILSAARFARQLRRLGGDNQTVDIAAPEGVATVADLDSATAAVLELLALLLPPVPHPLIRHLSETDLAVDQQIQAALDDQLLVRDPATETISFFHDSIEEEARRRAAAKPSIIASAAALLMSRFRSRDQRALYVLARNLAGSSGHESDSAEQAVTRGFQAAISNEDAVALLQSAAERSLRTASPKDAADFAERALKLLPRNAEAAARLPLHRLAHEAAFLNDDGRAMSRHLQSIQALGGAKEIAEARSLWISRTYGKMWIRGAVRIAWKIFADLGIIESADFDDPKVRVRQIRRARRYFCCRRPKRLASKIVAHGRSVRWQDEVIAATAASLFGAMLTIDPHRMIVLAYLVVSSGTKRGGTPLAGVGFTCWAAYLAEVARPLGLRQAVAAAGDDVSRVLAVAEGDQARLVVARCFGEALSLHWSQPYNTTTENLRSLFHHSVELGLFDWASLTASLYTQSRLLRGDSLPTLFEDTTDLRRRVASFGNLRYERSMAKFQQAQEVLMGRTGDVVTLTGSLVEEEAVRKELEERGDILGLFGFYHAKGMLAVYAGLPNDACRHFHSTLDANRGAASLSSVTSSWFLAAMAAYKASDRTFATHCHRIVRRDGVNAIGPHRILAVEAMKVLSRQSRQRGVPRKAHRLFLRAEAAALRAGFVNEGALIAEYHGDAMLAAGETAEAVRAYLFSESLYHRWGAIPAAERVAQRLGPVYSPARPQDSSAMSGETAAGPGELDRLRSLTQVLFEATRDGLMLLDPNGQVLLHNSATSPYVRTLEGDCFAVALGLSDSLGALVAQAISEGSSTDREIEWKGRTIAVSVNPLRNGDRAVAAIALRDITDLRNRERDMIVSDRLASLGMLSAEIAHEVENMNHILRLNARTLRTLVDRFEQREPEEPGVPNPDSFGPMVATVGEVLDASAKISEIVRSVRSFATEGRDGTTQDIAPEELVDRVLRFTQLFVSRYTSSVERIVELGLPSVRVIPGRLEQALVNLVKNACEALTDSSQKISLQVARDGATDVLFSVCDQGKGIPIQAVLDPDGATSRPLVTTRFSEGGTGLGLSIVRAIVEQHNGTIRFNKDDEWSTIVEIRIPASAET